jgi:peptidoglycan/xylan/chitin deacetylase (PgdA/CDA1 family)
MRAILTYHSIDDSGSPISVPPGVFAEHVRWMAGGRVRVLPLGDLLALDPDDPADAIAITFDDGFRNFRDASAALIAARLPVTLFVVTGHVGGSNTWGGRTERGIPTLPLLTWAELERLAADGVTMGAHTRTHPRLTTLSPGSIEEELDGCLHELGTRLGVRVDHFAYPYGAANEEVAALAGRRFKAAVTTRFSPLAGGDAPMLMPRLDMYYLRQPGALGTWGTAGFRRKLWSVRFRRQVREVLS